MVASGSPGTELSLGFAACKQSVGGKRLSALALLFDALASARENRLHGRSGTVLLARLALKTIQPVSELVSELFLQEHVGSTARGQCGMDTFAGLSPYAQPPHAKRQRTGDGGAGRRWQQRQGDGADADEGAAATPGARGVAALVAAAEDNPRFAERRRARRDDDDDDGDGRGDD
jgi:hypothetical protein